VAWELLINGTANGICFLHLVDSDAVKGLGKLLDDWVYHLFCFGIWNGFKLLGYGKGTLEK
jgi:hypothetical protein